MNTPNIDGRPRFVIRLTREIDENPPTTIGYAVVEQTQFIAADDRGGGEASLLLHEMQRLFDLHASETLAALPLPDHIGAHAPFDMASSAGSSADVRNAE